MIIPKSKLNGRYELAKELGRGAFGVAYLARDTRVHSQWVVVKILLEAEGGTFDDPSFRVGFDREGKALALINHPSVVRVYDHGWTPEGSPFIVMQYVEGKSLRGVMDGGQMELGRAARIVRQLGSALSAVHDAGVVHRDLKPENVMLQTSRDDEFAILIDFGLATVEDRQAWRHARDTWAGTPLYMAPEQLRGRPVAASDVWALGVVAYEMVTGRIPFSVADVLGLGDMPRAGTITEPKTLRPDLPRAAQGVILKALSYDPAQRYAHAHEMGEAFLRAVLDPEPTPLPSPGSESPKELLTRCQELFESFDEFRSPDSLRAFFSVAELRAYEKCIGRGGRLEFDPLIDCLYNQTGREYRGQGLIELLGGLASRYKGDYRGQECERLKGALRRVLERAPAAGR